MSAQASSASVSPNRCRASRKSAHMLPAPKINAGSRNATVVRRNPHGAVRQQGVQHMLILIRKLVRISATGDRA